MVLEGRGAREIQQLIQEMLPQPREWVVGPHCFRPGISVVGELRAPQPRLGGDGSSQQKRGVLPSAHPDVKLGHVNRKIPVGNQR